MMRSLWIGFASLVSIGLAVAQGNDPRPAPGPLPELPRRELQRGGAPEGDGTELPPNGSVLGVLYDTGQSNAHPLRLKQGEQVLLELFCAGFARGWTATAAIVIEDPKGELSLHRLRRGGVEFSAFTGFRAPVAGEYTLRVQAREGGFRYRMTRHADFTARGGQPETLGNRSQAFGYLLHDGDQHVFSFEVEAGEELALKVQSPVEKAVDELRALRWEADPSAAAGSMMMEESMTMEPARGERASRDRGQRGSSKPERSEEGRRGGRSETEPRGGRGQASEPQRGSMMGAVAPGRRMRDRDAAAGASWPDLQLQIVDEQGNPVSEPSHYLRWQAPGAGTYRVIVNCQEGSQGGLLRLDLERQPERVRVEGTVSDLEGWPQRDAELVFLMEPDMDREGTVVTDSQGRYSLELRPGPYRILLRSAQGTSEVQRTRIEEAEEVHLLLDR